MINNLEIWESAREVPDTAKKTIQAGKLKGFTDINPVWRLKKLTELFGPCGIGWYIDDVTSRVEDREGVSCVFVDLNLYTKNDGEWSKPIHGTGGSKLVSRNKNGADVSDECFKMAYTDAISVACKALGIGADVYWEKDKTKYSSNNGGEPTADDEKMFQDAVERLKRAVYKWKRKDADASADYIQSISSDLTDVERVNYYTDYVLKTMKAEANGRTEVHGSPD